MKNNPIEKPVILITGASSGIGYFCAAALKKDGFHVITTCRHPNDVTHMRNEGIDCVQMDLADSTSIQAAAKEFFSLSKGNIYALFNNAGYGQVGAMEDLSRKALRQQFEVNVLGTCELTNLLLPTMINQGFGRIIQNSSVLGFVGMRYRGAYAGSKFALEGISDCLRLELAGTGVYVSLIEAGPIRSLFRKNALDAFYENVDILQSRHSLHYQSVVDRLNAQENNNPFAKNPEAVYEKVLCALTAKKPKPRYRVTLPTQFLSVLKRLLSTRLLDKILARAKP